MWCLSIRSINTIIRPVFLFCLQLRTNIEINAYISHAYFKQTRTWYDKPLTQSLFRLGCAIWLSLPYSTLYVMTPSDLVMVGDCLIIYSASFTKRGDRRRYVDLVGVLPTQDGCRDATSTLLFVKEGKQDKHAYSCRSHNRDFAPYGFYSSRA